MMPVTGLVVSWRIQVAETRGLPAGDHSSLVAWAAQDELVLVALDNQVSEMGPSKCLVAHVAQAWVVAFHALPVASHEQAWVVAFHALPVASHERAWVVAFHALPVASHERA
jgi:hypothetical protein